MRSDAPLRCLVWQWGRFGGGPRYALELSQALRSHCGLDTRLSLAAGAEILDSPSFAALNDYPVETYRDRREFVLRTLTARRALAGVRAGLDEFRPDVAIVTMPAYWDFFLCRQLAARRIPFVTIIHDASLHPGDNFQLSDTMHRYEARRAASVVTLTDFVAKRLHERRILGSAPQHTIPHVAFDMPDLALPPPHPPIRDPAHPLKLLMAGRLKTYKGLDLLREALDRLPADRIALRIAGSASDRESLAAFESRPNVELALGWMSDAEFIANIDGADAVLLPYIEASQSGVAPLAFKRGRPVITTPVGGLPEQVRHEQNGLLAEHVSGAAVAEAIMRMADDPELFDACAAGAARSGRETLSWRAIAPQFASMLKKAAAA
jgi:glycosyltransferase involved in cell wall biosynthesis